MEELLGDNNLKTFKEPIVTTLLPNYFVIYYGQKVPQGAIMTDTDKVKSKKMHLGMGYDLWARFVDKTLTWQAWQLSYGRRWGQEGSVADAEIFPFLLGPRNLDSNCME